MFLLFIFPFLIVSCSGKKAIKEKPFDPVAKLQEANKLLEDDFFEEARKILFEVKNRDLSMKYAPIAQLKLAESFAKEEFPELAVSEYRRFIRMYPDHTQAPYAQYQIGLIYYNQIKSPSRGAGSARKALKEFQKLLMDYPRNPFREAVKIKIRKCRNFIAEYEFLVGKFYFKKESYNAAIERFEGLLKSFPDFRNRPEVLYLTGLAYKELNRHKESLRYLMDLRNQFPDNKYSRKAEKAIASLKK